MDINIHKVTKIELLRACPSNGNSRTIQITCKTFDGRNVKHSLTLFGNTNSLDLLPRLKEFCIFDKNDEPLEVD